MQVLSTQKVQFSDWDQVHRRSGLIVRVNVQILPVHQIKAIDIYVVQL